MCDVHYLLIDRQLDLNYTDPAQHLLTAGYDRDGQSVRCVEYWPLVSRRNARATSAYGRRAGAFSTTCFRGVVCFFRRRLRVASGHHHFMYKAPFWCVCNKAPIRAPALAHRACLLLDVAQLCIRIGDCNVFDGTFFDALLAILLSLIHI